MDIDSNNQFPGQPRDEITQRVVYKHIMAIAPVLFGMILLAIFLVAAIIYIDFNQQLVKSYVSLEIINIVGFGFVSIIFLLTFATFWIWRRNKIVFTNQHIVDVDQIGLFNRNVSTLRLEEIQDVSARINGPLETFMNYGTLIIQTAGERENFVFDYVPNPNELERYVIDLRRKYYGNKS